MQSRFIFPGLRLGQGQFKKPDTGMIYAALLNHTGVTWESSLMIGNRDDQQAAARAEIKFIQALI